MLPVCLVILLWLHLTFGSPDSNALLELKKGLQSDAFGVILESWDAESLASDGCPQNWHGVICNGANVEAIILDDSGLRGEFNFKAIATLKMLRNLSISNNQLTGSILDIALIESLENLDISRNSFHGLVPSDFTQLKSLISVNLSANGFDGVLPSGFRNLKMLKYLDLHSNRFSGDVMNLILELGGLLLVDLSFNQFVGNLDIGLGRASFVANIRYLNVSNNSLTGKLFTHDGMPYFDNLEVFDASNNHFNGSIPSFNFVVSLRVLRLGNNQLSGALPESLFQDNSMVISELDLSMNQLEGPVGSITSTSLRSLNLSSNQLSGSLPLKIGQCVMVDLSYNNFSGNLSRIKYWGNNVEVIQLSSNALTGTLPNETSQFLKLTSFMLSNNSLEGTLSPILGTYPELEVLDLSSNLLRGFILPILFNSTKLTYLNLSYNNFTGMIPLQVDIENMGDSLNFSLLSINLSHNFLSGPVPQELGKFHNLSYLDLSSNNFNGSLPQNLSDKLIKLNVSSNNLSGTVPENLRRFPDTAFHPGNSFLILPLSSLPYGSEKGHHSMKQAVIAFILAAVVGAAVVLVLLFLIIYYRFQVKEHRRMAKTDKTESKISKSSTSSLPSTSPSQKSVDPSITTHSSGQASNSPKGRPMPELEYTRNKVAKPEIPASPELANRHGETSSPISNLSFSRASPSKGQNLFPNLGTVKFGSPDKLAGDLHLFDGSLVFTSEQLSHAPAEVIGRSCHGMLYRATLDSGHILVVKRLKEGISKGRKEFGREAKKLGNIRHPNLVSLQGYYWGPREHEKLIITNYINSPCLGIYLQGPERSQVPCLSLDKRLKAARDVAQCLDYLHNEQAIPHGNLKSTNILIDPVKANVLVTDCSLHRLLISAGTADQVLSAGALGYLPPEFSSSTKPCPSLKSDIYAFGVILLELITGRSSAEIVSANQGAVDLTDWIKMLVNENRASDCFDRSGLGVNFTENEQKVLNRILQVALRCILPASERPDVRTVFHDLLSIEV